MLLCQMSDINGISWGGGMPWFKTGTTHYLAQSGLPDMGSAIKGIVVCNCCNQEPLDLLIIINRPLRYKKKRYFSKEVWSMRLDLL